VFWYSTNTLRKSNLYSLRRILYLQTLSINLFLLDFERNEDAIDFSKICVLDWGAHGCYKEAIPILGPALNTFKLVQSYL